MDPFFAASLSLDSGSFGAVLETPDPVATMRYKVLASPYAQGLTGVSYQDNDGLNVLVGIGWSQLLRGINLVWRSASTPTSVVSFPRSWAAALPLPPAADTRFRPSDAFQDVVGLPSARPLANLQVRLDAK